MSRAYGDEAIRGMLARLGRLDEDGISRGLRGRRCRQCGAGMLAGLDADVAGLVTFVDPRLVTPKGEMRALFSGGTSYRLRGGYLDAYIDYRTALDIEKHNAFDVDVLVSHRCIVMTYDCYQVRQFRKRPIRDVPIPF